MVSFGCVLMEVIRYLQVSGLNYLSPALFWLLLPPPNSISTVDSDKSLHIQLNHILNFFSTVIVGVCILCV